MRASFFLIYLVAILGSVLTASAQTRFSDNLSATGYYHFGYVLPEYDNFTYIVTDPIRAVTLNFSKKTRGNNDWEKIYNYPEYGFSIFYSTLGNDDIHGRELAITPYFRMNIISRKRFNFFNETGFGLGYVSKIFNPKDNYLNIAVGSHFNLHVGLKFGINYQVYKQWVVNAGFAFDHFSNANSKNPNLGINSVTSFAGLSHPIGRVTPTIERELAPHRKTIGYELIYSFGAKHSRGVLQSKMYYTSSITFETKWKVLRTIRLGAGADIFYDPSAQKEMEALNDFSYEKKNDFRTGIHFSQEFVYSKLSIILQEGFYIGLTDSVNGKTMYNRGIVRIQASPKMFVQLAMKSHLHILDYPELGLGLKW